MALLRSIVSVVAAVSCLSLAFGCSSYAWKEAKDKDTIASYRGFLATHPQDTNAEAAHNRLAELEFAEAQAVHTPLAYRRFLERNPDAPQADTARSLLETLRFNAAKERNSLPAWQQFLSENAEGAHRAEAETALAQLQKAELANTEDPKALADRMGRDPELATPELRTKLDDQSFARAKSGGAGKLLEYLDAFPAGAHRDEARLALWSLKVDGLLFSGMLTEAKTEIARSPLAEKLNDLPARVERAERFSRLDSERDPRIQAALPQKYVRSLSDLTHLTALPDPLDRWEAVEELGQHLSVAAIDPLLLAIRQGRNALVRELAFDSLSNVLRGLPQPVAEYEIAVRLKPLKTTASSAEVFLAIAVLLDLNGSLAEAAQAYEQAFDAQNADPLVLWRWSQIREERQQIYSAAVAARQLAVWARDTASALEGAAEEKGAGPSVAAARQLCAADRNAVFANDLLDRVRTKRTDFPEDLRAFVNLATEAKQLTRARLEDIELQLRTKDPSVRVCRDTAVRQRLEAGVRERGAALAKLRQSAPKLAGRVLAWSEQHDPSSALRAQAHAELAALPTGERGASR